MTKKHKAIRYGWCVMDMTDFWGLVGVCLFFIVLACAWGSIFG